ncbi:prealbumin-like fold domain-containing protein [Eubacterium callanderi]
MLYGCDEKYTHNNLQDDKIKSCWQTVIGTRISGTDGKIDFGNLYAGEYQLVETKTVPGYAKPMGQWRVTIDPEAAEPVKVSVKGSAPSFSKDGSNLSVANTKNFKLPFTGGTGDHRTTLMLTGIVLIVAAAGTTLVLKKRNNNKKINKKRKEQKNESEK